jgi:membrane protein implicated in regulation of membrane protease activity
VRLRRLRRRAVELVPTRRDLVVFGGYCLAAGVYIAIGVAFVDFLLSFWVGVAYLVVAAWLVPELVRRLEGPR